MSPVTHLLASWLVANTAPLNRREKTAVVVAGLAPDLDGLGLLPELLTRNSRHQLLWFSQYHHALHTLAFALVITAIAVIVSLSADFAFGRAFHHPTAPPKPWTTALLAFLSFHLHLFCDLIGSRSPDGYQWPIHYLEPFSSHLALIWHGQWALNSCENLLITVALLSSTLWFAWKSGSSPLEILSNRANRSFAATLRRWFPVKDSVAW